MVKQPKGLQLGTPQIDTGGPLALVVAWRTGARVVTRLVKTRGAVEDALRQAAADTTAAMTDGHPYSPDVDIEDNTHLVAARDELLDTELVDQLEMGSSLPLATDDEVRTRPLVCYAAVIGSGDSRTVFIRKRNPVQLATKSIVARLLDGTLDHVEYPLLAFDSRYDMVLTPEWAYVLDKRQFELMFRDSEAVLSKTSTWVDELAAGIPITQETKESLVDALRRNSHYRSKFHAILRRPHIKTLTTRELRAAMRKRGLEPDKFIKRGELDFSKQNIKTLLRLLNEDLFTGDFSSEQFAAGSKRQTSSGA